MFLLLQWPALQSTHQRLDLLFGLFLSLFAALEYVNYFHRQLMYDNRRYIAELLARKKLKPGLMAREFDWA